MKKVKRIIAGMAAAVMAFSTMSIGASAAMTVNHDVNVYFYSSSPQNSHVHHQENFVVNTTHQTIKLTAISKTYNGAYVNATNSMSSTLNVNCYSVSSNNYDIDYNLDLGALGTTATVTASLHNYQLGTYTGTVRFNV